MLLHLIGVIVPLLPFGEILVDHGVASALHLIGVIVPLLPFGKILVDLIVLLE